MVCSDLVSVNNGQISYSSVSLPYEFDTVASYTCNTGFGLVGMGTRTCISDGGLSSVGIWDGVAPSCEG